MTDFFHPISPAAERLVALLGTAGLAVLPLLLAVYGAALAAA